METSGARLAVTALEEEDFSGDTGGDGGGEAALASRDSGEAADVGPTGGQDAAECVAEHLTGEGSQRGWQCTEARCGSGRRLIRGEGSGDNEQPGVQLSGNAEAVFGHPVTKLMQNVEGGIEGAPDGGVVACPFSVVFSFGHVDGGSALISWDAVAGVEIDLNVAQLQGDEFGEPKTTDGGERYNESVPIVTVRVGSHAQLGGHQQVVYRKQQGGGSPDQP